MKTNLLLAVAAGGLMLLSANKAQAQETVVVEDVTATAVDCKTQYSSSWRDNWFLQLGAGIQIPKTDKYLTSGKAHTHITAVYNAGIGHWFSPYLGIRASAYYGRMHMDLGNYQSLKMANINADLMWDMCNSIAGPNANRVFSIIPFVGVGGTYLDELQNTVSGADKIWSLPVSAGIQLRLRLCKYVDFFAEGRANLYGDNFNGYVIDEPIESNFTVTGGININFGGRKYSAYNPCDYLAYLDNANQEVNGLRAELAATAAALAAAAAQLPCPEVVSESETIVVQAPLLSTVRFKINSAVISNEEMVNVYNIAQWMKANPDLNILVQGYADKNTGTSAYNMALSQRRAQAVIDALVNKYGIDASRLAVEANGSDVQPYDVNNWNRIVTFTQP